MDGTDATRSEAHCANHPEVQAYATCARCGSFMCAACRDADLTTHCAECAQRLSTSRLVRHVPALGITMMVQGTLTLLLGAYLGTFGGFMAKSLSDRPAPEGGQAVDDLLTTTMFAAVGVIAVAHLVAGALTVWLGWRVRTYRSRVLAMVVLGVALVLSTVGCYCAPTALGILIWGLIVLLDDEVRARFAASQGV